MHVSLMEAPGGQTRHYRRRMNNVAIGRIGNTLTSSATT